MQSSFTSLSKQVNRTGNPILNDPNNPALAFSNNDQRHRLIAALTYRKEYAGFGASQVSLFYEGGNQGRSSYTFNGDLNGDGVFNNDLIYIPNDRSEMNFVDITDRNSGEVLFSAAQQAEAFDAYIEQDPYLSANRSSYALRNGLLLPWVNRMDVSFMQEFYVNVGGKRNTLQLRADVINFTNLVNSDWGVGRAVNNNRPLVASGVNAEGEIQYQLAQFGGDLLDETFRFTNSLSDVWQLQLGVRYMFN